eukprot:10403738-Heterocapsa_arctica.AAC.1
MDIWTYGCMDIRTRGCADMRMCGHTDACLRRAQSARPCIAAGPRPPGVSQAKLTNYIIL